MAAAAERFAIFIGGVVSATYLKVMYSRTHHEESHKESSIGLAPRVVGRVKHQSMRFEFLVLVCVVWWEVR